MMMFLMRGGRGVVHGHVFPERDNLINKSDYARASRLRDVLILDVRVVLCERDKTKRDYYY